MCCTAVAQGFYCPPGAVTPNPCPANTGSPQLSVAASSCVPLAGYLGAPGFPAAPCPEVAKRSLALHQFPTHVKPPDFPSLSAPTNLVVSSPCSRPNSGPPHRQSAVPAVFSLFIQAACRMGTAFQLFLPLGTPSIASPSSLHTQILLQLHAHAIICKYCHRTGTVTDHTLKVDCTSHSY
jgi:hypothetical protein